MFHGPATSVAQLALCSALLAALVGPASATEAPHPCHVRGVEHEVKCGSVTRPLDPATPEGVKIEVRYVVVSARARNKLPDPIFLLAGGPGQSAISVVSAMQPLFGRLANRRDVVYVDQRGTGTSAPLLCDEDPRRSLTEEADSAREIQEMMRCRKQLQKLPYGDLRFFTTSIAMQDLDAVRRELGADRINLVGESYGTRAGLEYMRAFPQAVRRAVLDGMAPPDLGLTGSIATDAERSLSALIAACESDLICRADHPDLKRAWAAFLASLPRQGSAGNPLTGQVETFTLTRELVENAIRGPLYSPALAAGLPAAMDAAMKGRYEPLLGLSSLMSFRGVTRLAYGMHFSVVCSEDVRGEKSVDGAGDNDMAERYRKICAEWPRHEVSPEYYRVPVASAPTLLLSGGIDPVLPPRHAERVAKQLGPKALSVVVPNAGHNVLAIGCMHEVLFEFIDAIDDDAALHVKTGCAKDVPRPPAFRPVALPSVKP